MSDPALPTRSIRMYVDRSIDVPAGQVVKTDYVEIHRIKTACKDRMSIGDVKGAFEKRLQMGSRQPWPCPWGYWDEDGWFVVVDGRHEFVASIMLGLTHILVAWLAERKDQES